MDATCRKESSLLSSPFSSPNVSALLKIKIISRSQETGIPLSVHVRVANRSFNLHKHPLISKSGYFSKKLNESNEVELPPDFPGGSETFETIALFVYGSSTLVDPFNVASLRCAAEFLEMTEEYTSCNLSERFDIYLNQVVLQNWDDTLIVLQKCHSLLPWAEDLLIVSRCIESLAFMACMETLDPERRRDHPVVTLEALANQPWTSEMVKNIVSQDLWIKDLIALPFGFFERIIGSLRRQGMKEIYVSPIIIFFANKWILLKKTCTFWEKSGEKSREDDIDNKVSSLLTGVLDLLPLGEKASKFIPIGFYFSLLSRSLELRLENDSTGKLQDQIASLLHLTRVEDFLLPISGTESISSSTELATMESIFSTYVSSNVEANQTPSNNSTVAELWDIYLNQIARDPKMDSKRFMNLIEIVPISSRQSHDLLYRALNTFTQVHPDMSREEKGLVCRYLDCQKLSQEMCIEAVQNELMPLRLIVQALFFQQLNTHQAFKECSDSFRYANCGEFSGSFSSSRYANSKSPYMDGGEVGTKPLSFLPQKDPEILRSDFRAEFSSRKDYESTSFRLQNLEQELVSLKRTLPLHNISKKTEVISNRTEQISANTQRLRSFGLEGRTMSTKKNPIGQVTSCIGSVNFSSQRKYASRLLNVFRSISLFGRGKSKRKTDGPNLWP